MLFRSDTRDSLQSTIDWYSQNNLHCLQINPLILVGRNSILRPIQSEFDRDAEKYGYVFSDTINEFWITSWKNGKWTSENSAIFANNLLQKVQHKNKLTCWISIGLDGFGWDQDMILTTPQRELPWDNIRGHTIQKYQEYYQKLMSA